MIRLRRRTVLPVLAPLFAVLTMLGRDGVGSRGRLPLLVLLGPRRRQLGVRDPGPVDRPALRRRRPGLPLLGERGLAGLREAARGRGVRDDLREDARAGRLETGRPRHSTSARARTRRPARRRPVRVRPAPASRRRRRRRTRSPRSPSRSATTRTRCCAPSRATRARGAVSRSQPQTRRLRLRPRLAIRVPPAKATPASRAATPPIKARRSAWSPASGRWPCWARQRSGRRVADGAADGWVRDERSQQCGRGQPFRARRSPTSEAAQPAAGDPLQRPPPRRLVALGPRSRHRRLPHHEPPPPRPPHSGGGLRRSHPPHRKPPGPAPTPPSSNSPSPYSPSASSSPSSSAPPSPAPTPSSPSPNSPSPTGRRASASAAGSPRRAWSSRCTTA